MEAAATKRPTDVAEAATTSAANPMASATDMAKTNTTNAAAAMEATAAGKQCVADDSSAGSNAIWTPPQGHTISPSSNHQMNTSSNGDNHLAPDREGWHRNVTVI